MTILPFEHTDLPALINVQPRDWPDLTPFFQFYLEHNFCFPIKVIIGNELVGTGAIIVHDEVAWLAHIIVSANHRNKGIGQLITKYLIDLATKKGCTTLYLIATDLGAPVYEKLGFETESNYVFFKDLKSPDAPLNSSCIVPFEQVHFSEVARLDKLVSGENRTPHLLEHFNKGFIFEKNNLIEGYYLPTFSEGLIVAITPEAGIAFTLQKLRTTDKCCFPSENHIALNFFHQVGYQEFKTAKRMRLGKERPLELDKIYSRIGGYLG